MLACWFFPQLGDRLKNNKVNYTKYYCKSWLLRQHLDKGLYNMLTVLINNEYNAIEHIIKVDEIICVTVVVIEWINILQNILSGVLFSCLTRGMVRCSHFRQINVLPPHFLGICNNPIKIIWIFSRRILCGLMLCASYAAKIIPLLYISSDISIARPGVLLTKSPKMTRGFTYLFVIFGHLVKKNAPRPSDFWKRA